MSLKKVHEKRNVNGDLVEPDGPIEKRPRTSTPTIEGQFSDCDSDISEVYDDLSCPEQCLRPEEHSPNYAYNADGTVDDKLTQYPVHHGVPEEEPDRPVVEEPEPEIEEPPADFIDFPLDELDAILDAAANPPPVRHSPSVIRPPLVLNTPKVYTNPEDPFEVMFFRHLLPMCHIYDPREPGQIASGDPRYLNWKLEKHAYNHVVKLVKEEHCYVQEMDEYFLKHDNTNLAIHSIYPGSVNHGFELGRIYAYAEHHPGSSTDVLCRGDRWHNHSLTVNPARYHAQKGTWLPRLEPPKYRRVVWFRPWFR